MEPALKKKKMKYLQQKEEQGILEQMVWPPQVLDLITQRDRSSWDSLNPQKFPEMPGTTHLLHAGSKRFAPKGRKRARKSETFTSPPPHLPSFMLAFLESPFRFERSVQQQIFIPSDILSLSVVIKHQSHPEERPCWRQGFDILQSDEVWLHYLPENFMWKGHQSWATKCTPIVLAPEKLSPSIMPTIFCKSFCYFWADIPGAAGCLCSLSIRHLKVPVHPGWRPVSNCFMIASEQCGAPQQLPELRMPRLLTAFVGCTRCFEKLF